MDKLRFTPRLYAGILAGMVCLAPAHAVNYYVSPDGDDAHDGLTPAAAKRTIQAALAPAGDGDTVLVNDGLYELTATLAITNGVTVRSINGRAVTILDGQGARRCVELDHAAARLEGFTVRRGLSEADDEPPEAAGVQNLQGVVYDCLITGNHAVIAGGVMNGAQGQLLDCEISHNTAQITTAGVWNEGLAQNCAVISNTAAPGGLLLYAGGIFNQGGVVRDCWIACNTAVFAGGVLNVQGLVQNCLVEYNTAGEAGGIWNDDDSFLFDCTIRYNQAIIMLDAF